MIPVSQIRNDFPILSDKINGHDLVYLDNAATTQVPACVIRYMVNHYSHGNANVHRGVHTLSSHATAAYEKARETAAAYIGAPDPAHVVFTSGTTHAVNMTAQSLQDAVEPGDTVAVTELEHHSNFLPWKRLCAVTGAHFEVIPCPGGGFSMEEFRRTLNSHPKIVAVSQVSNLTGSTPPLKEIIEAAHAVGTRVFVDGAQGIRHARRDALEAGADFYCFSGHKILAPTGTGVLYAADLSTPPAELGGGMVDSVTADAVTLSPAPHRYEAGTPNSAGAGALGTALQYMEEIGPEQAAAYEKELVDLAAALLADIEEITILGSPENRRGCVSFTVESLDPYDVAMMLDRQGIAVRTGHHCAQPALTGLGAVSAVRISPALYNTPEEILFTALQLKSAIHQLKRWSA